MNISAILVVVSSDEIQIMMDRISALPGLEVHHSEASTGRLIVTQEAPSIDAEVDGLRRLQQLPGVRLAEMVEHHFQSEAAADNDPTEIVPELLCN